MLNINEAKTSELKYYSHPLIDPLIDSNFKQVRYNEGIKYFLGMLSLSQFKRQKFILSNNTNKKIDDFSWFPYELYRKLFGDINYKNILNFLITNGIIIKEERPGKFKHTFSVYKFSDPKYTVNFTKKKINSYILKKQISKYYEWRKKRFSDFDTQLFNNMIEDIVKIDITKEQLDEIYKNKFNTSYKGKLSYDEYMKISDITFNIVDYWNNSATYDEKMEMMSAPVDGGRIYHILTNIPKECRKYIRGKNNKLQKYNEFDMKNCQPTFLADEMKKSDPSLVFMDDFIKSVENSTIYETIMKHFNNSITRDEAKVYMMKFMYCQKNQKDQEVFESIFPYAGRWIKNNWKSKDYYEDDSNGKKVRKVPLAHHLQMLEATAFRDVWKYCLDNNITFFTCHDAIYIAGIDCYSKKKSIKNMIYSKICKYVNIRFKISDGGKARGRKRKV